MSEGSDRYDELAWQVVRGEVGDRTDQSDRTDRSEKILKDSVLISGGVYNKVLRIIFIAGVAQRKSS
ncbi:MAG: hypothetical protein U9N73_01080 [Candidatus Auribacterota bacterium]|nr:hypothetical protein [Candidatus Auribacterota bacterium]